MAPVRITPRNARRAIGIAKIVVPLAVPLAFQAAAYTRDRWDRAKADRLGVPVERLGEFTGRGAALHARIANLAAAVGELQLTRSDQAEFTESSGRRLGDLAAAVRAAEQMPRIRRRGAHQAVSTELDLVEAAVLDRLGIVRTGALRN